MRVIFVRPKPTEANPYGGLQVAATAGGLRLEIDGPCQIIEVDPVRPWITTGDYSEPPLKPGE